MILDVGMRPTLNFSAIERLKKPFVTPLTEIHLMQIEASGLPLAY